MSKGRTHDVMHTWQSAQIAPGDCFLLRQGKSNGAVSETIITSSTYVEFVYVSLYFLRVFGGEAARGGLP